MTKKKGASDVTATITLTLDGKKETMPLEDFGREVKRGAFKMMSGKDLGALTSQDSGSKSPTGGRVMAKVDRQKAALAAIAADLKYTAGLATKLHVVIAELEAKRGLLSYEERTALQAKRDLLEGAFVRAKQDLAAVLPYRLPPGSGGEGPVGDSQPELFEDDEQPELASAGRK